MIFGFLGPNELSVIAERCRYHRGVRKKEVNYYLTFLFITLKVQDIHNFFSKRFPFTFLRFHFLKYLHVWSTV